MAYLYYLPFAAVFTSNDKLHQRTVPLFLGEGQSYLSATELKGSLSELDAHYSALPDAVKELGVLTFASYPPPDMANSVTRLWDRHTRPDWREIAKKREAELGKPREESSDSTTLDDIKERLAKAEPVSNVAEPEGGADYFVISRRVPARKGKWRIVSEEIEDRDSED
jgi:hypothetical protein